MPNRIYYCSTLFSDRVLPFLYFWPVMIKMQKRTRAQDSRAAIQRLYIAMRHLFIRGSYKPLGVSGEAMIEALMQLRPEIYGSIADPERVELEGLLYIVQRLPQGIEECRYIKLISREGYEHSHFPPIIPTKRRRQCYRIDAEQLFIEMTRGRSDIYDILTHLTFMYIEAEKIRKNGQDGKNGKRRDWLMLEDIVRREAEGLEFNLEQAYSYLSTLLGRTYEETVVACEKFANTSGVNSIFHFTYWLGQKSFEEAQEGKDREISFSSALREEIGHHYHGELWARAIKQFLADRDLLQRPLHLISANLHSVLNTVYAPKALAKELGNQSIGQIAQQLSQPENALLQKKVQAFALKNGLYFLPDNSGMNIDVQIIDTAKMGLDCLSSGIKFDADYLNRTKPVLLIINYAFGEQAYEVMDELLKPHEDDNIETPLNMASISIMGKAGILQGGKGDIMIPNAHVFEGTADNYPFENDFDTADFEGHGMQVFDDGPMITVLGTSLQNRDIMRYFNRSSWRAIGLEMEGAHYQKAIQGAARIRKSVNRDVKVRYAYYASDNPLISGQTLASGSLGLDGVKPTYLITTNILNKIFTNGR